MLVKELAADEAIAAADTLLLTVPNTLGVEYNAHMIKTVLKYVAQKPVGANWRSGSKCMPPRPIPSNNMIRNAFLATLPEVEQP